MPYRSRRRTRWRRMTSAPPGQHGVATSKTVRVCGSPQGAERSLEIDATTASCSTSGDESAAHASRRAVAGRKRFYHEHAFREFTIVDRRRATRSRSDRGGAERHHRRPTAKRCGSRRNDSKILGVDRDGCRLSFFSAAWTTARAIHARRVAGVVVGVRNSTSPSSTRTRNPRHVSVGAGPRASYSPPTANAATSLPLRGPWRSSTSPRAKSNAPITGTGLGRHLLVDRANVDIFARRRAS
jgi:hypothetical protein